MLALPLTTAYGGQGVHDVGGTSSACTTVTLSKRVDSGVPRRSNTLALTQWPFSISSGKVSRFAVKCKSPIERHKVQRIRPAHSSFQSSIRPSTVMTDVLAKP
ncbi:MAG TPA: hypothetical protein DCP03_09670 [Polaromonas sp.]|nr:hypothetical protein [Polaromonas sp.]